MAETDGEPSDAGLMDDVPRGKDWEFKRTQTRPEARWQNPKDITAYPPLRYDPDKPEGKILVGALGDTLIGIRDNRHILTVAGSRAGKSVTLIANLYFYNGSVLCNDVKGELAEITAVRRAALGQKVYVLDPFKNVRGDAVKYRAAYNPMALLTLDNPTIIEDAVQITDALVIKSGEEKDPHWNESAGHFLTGLILYAAVADKIKDKDRHLGMVRFMLSRALTRRGDPPRYALFREVLDACKQLLDDGHVAVADAIEGSVRGFYEKATDERAAVLSTANRHTQFLEYESMREVLSGHDFSLKDLKADPNGISVYLCLPATRMEMCNRWLRLFINQLMVAMEQERRKPDAPVLVCLDEFPVLGFMSQLQAAAGQVASFDVQLWTILQDWGQGKALYGERFESFAANAGIFQAFGNVDLTTTEYISRALGDTIIEAGRRGEASPEQRTQGLSGLSVSAESCPLLTPDEVARFFARSDDKKRQLIRWAGYNPMILQRVEYFDPKGPLRRWLAKNDRTGD